MERTLSIIKPDATARNITGQINTMIEASDLRIVAQKRIRLTQEQAKEFYKEHKDKVFFPSMIQQMISGPVVVQVLEGENAIKHYREIMGATNPAVAEEGTIRKKYAESIEAAKQALEFDEDLAEAYYVVGVCYYNLAVRMVRPDHVDMELYRKTHAQIRDYYAKARPYLETFRRLAPDESARWAPLLYRIYFSLNMGEQFEEFYPDETALYELILQVFYEEV